MLDGTVLGVSPQRPRGSLDAVERASSPHPPTRAPSRADVAARRRSVPFVAVALSAAMCLGAAACRTDTAASGQPTSVPPATAAPTTTSIAPTTTTAAVTTTAAPAADGSDLHPLVVEPGQWSDEELAIINGYVNAELASAVADSKPDENDAGLLATHLDPMLAQRRKVFEAHRIQGRASRMPTNQSFVIRAERIEMIDADTARLWVCESSDGPLYEIATGTVIDGTVDTVRELTALRRIGGTWRLTERVSKGRWEGVVACPAE